MGKYAETIDSVYSIFGTAEWIAENIKTFPTNFTSPVTGEYIRVTVLASGANASNPLKSVSGLLMIDIFVPVGSAASRSTAIADKLDSYLAGKTIATSSGSTQLMSSNLTPLGEDKANQSLYRFSYSIPFNFFGK